MVISLITHNLYLKMYFLLLITIKSTTLNKVELTKYLHNIPKFRLESTILLYFANILIQFAIFKNVIMIYVSFQKTKENDHLLCLIFFF